MASCRIRWSQRVGAPFGESRQSGRSKNVLRGPQSLMTLKKTVNRNLGAEPAPVWTLGQDGRDGRPSAASGGGGGQGA